MPTFNGHKLANNCPIKELYTQFFKIFQRGNIIILSKNRSKILLLDFSYLLMQIGGDERTDS